MYAVQHTFVPPFPGRPRRRIIVAVAVSILVHAWMVHINAGVSSAPFDGRRPPAPELSVVLDAQPSTADLVAGPSAPVSPFEPSSSRAAPRKHAEHSVAKIVRETHDQQPREGAPGISDPTYYGARDLDVYPAIATKLDLEVPLRNNRGAAGRVQLLVLVNAAGIVEEARVVSADPAGMYDEMVQRIFLAARFTPGERGGRPVKTRLLVELDFGGER